MAIETREIVLGTHLVVGVLFLGWAALNATQGAFVPAGLRGFIGLAVVGAGVALYRLRDD